MAKIGGKKELLEKFTQQEMMCCACARYIPNDAIMDIGVGLGLVAANLAKEVYSPDAVFMYESGSVDATVVGDRLPEGIDDSVIQADTPCITDLLHVLGWATMSGRSSHTLLGFAQADKYGNLNTTCMGNYYDPDIRFPGSGGAHDLGTGAVHPILLGPQSRRTLVNKLDYKTTLGYGEDGHFRERVWYPGKGPMVIVTNLGEYEPDPITHEFILTGVMAYSSVEECVETCGWDLKVSPDVKEVAPPTEAETKALREKLDREGRNTGWTKLANK
ncbi:MAG: CoA-transferase [Chloroflexota bacterium]|nr:CoA-transferase [Chloroflexota bacterium]